MVPSAKRELALRRLAVNAPTPNISGLLLQWPKFHQVHNMKGIKTVLKVYSKKNIKKIINHFNNLVFVFFLFPKKIYNLNYHIFCCNLEDQGNQYNGKLTSQEENN